MPAFGMVVANVEAADGTGICPAGPVRRPFDVLPATDDATRAVPEAIHAVTNAALGRAAHPRAVGR